MRVCEVCLTERKTNLGEHISLGIREPHTRYSYNKRVPNRAPFYK